MAQAKLVILLCVSALAIGCRDPQGTCETVFKEGNTGTLCLVDQLKSDCMLNSKQNTFTEESAEEGVKHCERLGYDRIPPEPDGKDPRPAFIKPLKRLFPKKAPAR